MENVTVPTSKQPTEHPDNQNDGKENKLHSLKEVPKRGLVQIKESFKTLKNVNRQPTANGKLRVLLNASLNPIYLIRVCIDIFTCDHFISEDQYNLKPMILAVLTFFFLTFLFVYLCLCIT